jgi:hypothetical protein
MSQCVHIRQRNLLILLPEEGVRFMLDGFVEGLHVIEAGLEETAVSRITVRGDAAEEDGSALVETAAHDGQSVFQVHRNIIEFHSKGWMTLIKVIGGTPSGLLR